MKHWLFNEEQLDQALSAYIGQMENVALQNVTPDCHRTMIKSFLFSGEASQAGMVNENWDLSEEDLLP